MDHSSSIPRDSFLSAVVQGLRFTQHRTFVSPCRCLGLTVQVAVKAARACCAKSVTDRALTRQPYNLINSDAVNKLGCHVSQVLRVKGLVEVRSEGEWWNAIIRSIQMVGNGEDLADVWVEYEVRPKP